VLSAAAIVLVVVVMVKFLNSITERSLKRNWMKLMRDGHTHGIFPKFWTVMVLICEDKLVCADTMPFQVHSHFLQKI
jgi:hypothetical protein